MTTIVTRTTVGSNTGKGSPLTHTEVDTNFVNLNTAKLETAAIPLGTLQAPSVSFLNDSDTGIFCPQGGNSLAVATGGQYAITCTSTQAVGIKTANPQKALHVAGPTRVGADDATDAFLEIGEGATGNRNSYIDIVADTTYTDYGLRIIRNNTGANATSELKHRGTGALNFTTQDAAPIVFNTTNSPRLTILAGGNVGIGTSSPGEKLTVAGNISLSAAQPYISLIDSIWGAGSTFRSGVNTLGTATGDYQLFNVPTGKGFAFAQNNATNSLVIDTSGRVGIGSTGPVCNLDVFTASSATEVRIRNNTDGLRLVANTDGTQLIRSVFNYGIVFGTGTSSINDTFREAFRVDGSQRLLVGTSTARDNFFNAASGNAWQFQVEGTDYKNSCASFTSNTTSTGDGPHLILARSRGPAVGSNAIVSSASGGDSLGLISFQGADGSKFVQGAKIEALVDGTPGAADMPGRLVFSTTADGASSPTEAMRINNDRDVFIGTTTINPGIGNTTGGVMIRGGAGGNGNYVAVSRDGGTPLFVNRSTDDGTLVDFNQAGVSEGTISVSGTTVSYNGGHLSRWSQLPSGAERTEILRGSVLSNLDEMCEWGEEENEQLNRMKVSDVEGDKNVSGVFQAWDDDDDTYTNDFYCAMTGDFVIRIAEGVTVERGDLLMSAGDGTAKPQDDDIIRSKTIAKVTSINVSCTYEDGSYCVPCVLMAC